MPQDGHWLDRYFKLPPPPPNGFSAAKTMKIPRCIILKTQTAVSAWFLLKDFRHIFSVSAVCVRNSVMPISTLANNKRSCSINSGKV